MALEQVRSRSPDSWAQKVAYKHRGILEDAAATVFLPSDLTAPELSRDHMRRHLPSIFFTKLTDWQSEHEYRFLESRAAPAPTASPYGTGGFAAVSGVHEGLGAHVLTPDGRFFSLVGDEIYGGAEDIERVFQFAYQVHGKDAMTRSPSSAT